MCTLAHLTSIFSCITHCISFFLVHTLLFTVCIVSCVLVSCVLPVCPSVFPPSCKGDVECILVCLPPFSMCQVSISLFLFTNFLFYFLNLLFCVCCVHLCTPWLVSVILVTCPSQLFPLSPRYLCIFVCFFHCSVWSSSPPPVIPVWAFVVCVLPGWLYFKVCS